jgi:hypothetical protein
VGETDLDARRRSVPWRLARIASLLQDDLILQARSMLQV